MGSTGYQSNNVSDEVKYTNLTNLVSEMLDRSQLFSMNNPHLLYVELHSGPGRYSVDGTVTDGSAIRVMRMLRDWKWKMGYNVFLHEKDDKLRGELEKNIEPFNENENISVAGDWKDEIKRSIACVASQTLFLLDPTHLDDYDEDNGLLHWLGPILDSGATVFMYAPQNVHPRFKASKKHAKIITKIKRVIKQHGRNTGLDLMHFSGKGFHKRIDHNIIAGTGILELFPGPHREVCERIKALKPGYPSFRNIS